VQRALDSARAGLTDEQETHRAISNLRTEYSPAARTAAQLQAAGRAAAAEKEAVTHVAVR